MARGGQAQIMLEVVEVAVLVVFLAEATHCLPQEMVAHMVAVYSHIPLLILIINQPLVAVRFVLWLQVLRANFHLHV